MNTGKDTFPDIFRSAGWIWDGEHFRNLYNSFVRMRRSFTLQKVPRTAEVAVSADSRYKLYVNGELVNYGPARGYQETQPFDRIDLAPWLRPGRNVICAMVHNYGKSNFQYLSRERAGFILGGRIGREDVSTDSRWKVLRSDARRKFVAQLAITLGFQEHYDARIEDDAWLAIDFDDSGWHTPYNTRAGSMPWHTFEERGIPLLEMRPETPPTLLARGKGKNSPGYETAENLILPYLAEERSWEKKPTPQAPGNMELCFETEPAARGEFRAYLLDFGQGVAGFPRLQIDGAHGGEVIDLVYSETVTGFDPDYLPVEQGSCGESFASRVIARKGQTEFEAFNILGMRYVLVLVRLAESKLRLRVSLTSALYPLDVRGAYHSDNPVLERLYSMAALTQRLCMFDAYVDCPFREQVQWWGDTLVQGSNTLYLSGDMRLYARGLRQIGAQRVPNGLTYGHAPTMAHHCILPDYTLFWHVTHHDYYTNTGDLELFKASREAILDTLRYFANQTQENGLIAHDPRYWLFLDWANVYRDGTPTIYNLIYLYALRKLVELFKAARDTAQARTLERRAAALEAAIIARLYDAKRGELYAGLDLKGKPVRQASPHVATWAMMTGVLPEHHDAWTESILLPLVNGPCEHPALPSPYFMFYVFELLKARGHGAEVLACVERWWKRFIDEGFATLPEVWEHVKGFRSACHAWTAHPIIQIANLHLGVRRRGIAWHEIEFEPVFERAERVSGTVATPRGDIAVAWQREGNAVRVELGLPEGIAARVKLPGVQRMVTGHKVFELTLP